MVEQKKTINGKVYEFSGGKPRKGRELKSFIAELKSWGLETKTFAHPKMPKYYVVYVRRKQKW